MWLCMRLHQKKLKTFKIAELLQLLMSCCRADIIATRGVVHEMGVNWSTVTYTLHLRRNPLSYVVNLIVPCGLLSFIAVSTFILQPACHHRLTLGE